MSNLLGVATNIYGLDSALIGYSPRAQNLGPGYSNCACVSAVTSTNSNYNLFSGVKDCKPGSANPTDGTRVFLVDNNGNVYNNSGTYSTLSDYRIKKNIIDMDEDLTVTNLRPVSYELIDKYDINNKLYGFIAHEVQEHLPHLVSGYKDELDENGEIKEQTVNLMGLVPILVKDIIKLDKKIINLENELSEIKNIIKDK